MICDYAGQGAPWSSLPSVCVEAVGSTLTIIGGEMVAHIGTLAKVSAVAGIAGNQYGNISITNTVMEMNDSIGLLGATSTNSLSAPGFGGLTYMGCPGIILGNNQAAVQLDASYGGKVVFLGNRLFASTNRSNLNILSGSSTAQITVDVSSFNINMLQGYDGLSGGVQYVNGAPALAWKSYTATVAAQTNTITTLGTCSTSYLRDGKKITLAYDIQVTTAGTATGAIKVSLPFTAKSGKNFVGACYEYDTAGAAGTATINTAVNDATNLYIRTSAGGSFFANGRKVAGTIEFETA
jgi:hypothetical protein